MLGTDGVVIVRRVGQLIALTSILLLLAACGGGGTRESFDEIEAVPDYLRPEGLVAGVGTNEFANGFLRLIVTGQGRGDAGQLFIEPNGETTQTDFTVEAKLRIVNSGRVTLWLRSDAATCSGYGLVLDPTRDNYRLATIGDNCDVENLDTRSRLAIELDQWYTLRIEARGNRIQGFVDTVQFFDVEDDTYQAGAAFIEVITDGTVPAQIEIDEISIG